MTLLNGSLQADGSFSGRQNVRATGADTTVLINDQRILVSAAGGQRRVTFVPGVGNAGQQVEIDKTDVTDNHVVISDGTNDLFALVSPANGQIFQSVIVLSYNNQLSFS